jgi:PAS domain S-box-containing protein
VDFSALEYVPDAIVIIERRAGRIVFVNRVAEELFGYARLEVVGRPVEVLIPARVRAAHEVHRGEYDAAPRVRPMGMGADLFAVTKSGQEFPAEISLAPLDDGTNTYAVAAVRDVTERKAIERRAQLYRKAQEELRERDEFLSIASHELRTPIAALQLRVQVMQRAADRTDDPVGRQHLQNLAVLERLTRRITLLVNGLLDVSRARIGSLKLDRTDVDLAEVMRQSADLLADELTRSGSKLVLGPMASVVGRWDRARLEQVVTNLLVNALKFGQGQPIVVSVRGDGARARATITDAGIGIAPEDQARIFERFERTDAARQFGGLGLGLYICRQIVEAHGGAISVQSAPGAGATFTVDLPREPTPATALGSRDLSRGRTASPPAGWRSNPAGVPSRLGRNRSRRQGRRTGGVGAPAGVGLDLYIVDHIIRAHGGTIDVHSTAAEGTTFVVRLPREPPDRTTP